MRHASIAALLLLAGAALAAPMGDAELLLSLDQGGVDAQEAARWLGEIESAAGLRALIARGDRQRLADYRRGFPARYGPVAQFPFVDEQLPEAIEQVLVETLADAQLDARVKEDALDLLQRRRYRSRALFEQLRALTRHDDWRLRGDGLTLITRTDLPGIEPEVLEIFRTVADERRALLLPFFVQRQYRPALPVLQDDVRARTPRGGIGHQAYGAIAGLGTAEAAPFLLAELDQYRTPTLDNASRSSLLALLGALAKLPPQTPLPLAGLRGRVPQLQDEKVAEAWQRLLLARRDPGTVEELLALAVDRPRWTAVREALLAMETPQAWARIRAALQPRLQQANPLQQDFQRLDERLRLREADPAAYLAQQEQRRRHAAAEQRLQALQEQYEEPLRALRERDPARHAEAQATVQRLRERAVLEQAELLPDRVADLAEQYEQEAQVLRFARRQPREALQAMQRALELRKRVDPALEPELAQLLWLADTWRFDLHDKTQALAHYRQLLARAQAAVDDAAYTQVRQGLRYWLPHEIAYLERGQAFSGALAYDEVSAVSTALMYLRPPLLGRPGSDAIWPASELAPARGPERFRLQLERAPTSQLMLLDARPFLALQPDADAVLRFLERQDPARYLSAALLAHFDYAGKSPWLRATQPYTMLIDAARGELPDHREALRAAAARFRRQHGIRVVAYADTRLATPEQTWRLLLAALQEQEVETVARCFSDAAAARVRALLGAVPPLAWSDYGSRLIALAEAGRTATTAHYTVVRQARRGGVERSRHVGFVREGERWRIDDIDFLQPLAEEQAAALTAPGARPAAP